jgi:hypothetical protein
MSRELRLLIIIAVLSILAAAAMLLGACDKKQPDIPSRNPLPDSSTRSG